MRMSLQWVGLRCACVFACLTCAATAETPRNGAHDFDFARGRWHTHAIQVQDPFESGSHKVTLEGTKTSRALWGGKAWVEEIEADGPQGHWEGMTFFVYNPNSGQWSQMYIDSSGEIEAPTIGSFKDGRGEFYGTETNKGRNVLVRGVWSDITADSHHFEISLSRDGGRTWVTSFEADLTRLKDKP
jgi:hypothetical protein